jgi:hypothetical protein
MSQPEILNCPCYKCTKGGVMILNDEATYIFKKAIRKDKRINYSNKEFGCREYSSRFFEQDCLKENFSKLISYDCVQQEQIIL